MAEHSVLSPLPGTFYRKPTPDAAPYVEVGETVTAGTVIGLVEVMKQFSEVHAEVDGTLTAFAVEDGDPVEPGQLLATLSGVAS
ncbi:acetyl-CoA carboxylase [Pseudomonas oryzihabitans]|jgi:biotin carboxyl carrier protein|uniref:acetyl-CoA carboxylase n=1 Tax=Pseudomonas oryzihabitans TaxID=47885 RepID=UPI002556F7FD|nr:acetyl-CoA carboxylase [Pseudomonas oryzihabitans]MDK8264395.1 acetyl-CoA carboxylase [Pseudomonas oryzihabitans]